MTAVAVLFSVCFITAWLITGMVRRYALNNSILDLPNARSSHSSPTPRGGGLAIAGIVLTGAAILAARGLIPVDLGIALVGGGSVVAGVGWIDDYRHVPAGIRALFHFLAACWSVFWLGGLPDLTVGVAVVPLGAGGAVLAIVGIVWLINLYNFMDGIDGIAGGEAVSVGLLSGGLLLMSGAVGLAMVSLLIAAASAGFLMWNWAPAKIFMGDVGSGLLGFLFGVLAISSENTGSLSLMVWILLLAVFVVDATLTLVRRVAHGEQWYAAHNSHAYQRLVLSGLSHPRVSGSVIGINLALGGLAVIAVKYSALAPLLTVLGCAVLASIYLAVERRNPMSRASSGDAGG